MATDNSTTTPPISDSNSLPASTNTTSTVFISTVTSSTIRSPTTRSTTDARRSSDVWTTSTITFVTVSHSTPTTGTLTTVVLISGASSPSSTSFRRPLSSVGGLTHTWPTTGTVTEGVPKSESTNSTTSGSASKSQRHPSVPILVVIGLVVASFIFGILFLFYRRRRRRLRLRQKEVEYIIQRPESCSSFLDTDPFVCVTKTLAPSIRSAEDEDQRRKTQPGLDATMTSNWWDSVDNRAFVFRKPRSLENDNAATHSDSQHGTQRPSPRLPTTYPSTLFEQDEMTEVGGEGQSLEYNASDGPSTPIIPISCHVPPPRPPRSPRLKYKRSARHSFDSVSTTHSSSASLLYRPSPENRLEEVSITPLNVKKKSSLL